ncbi:DNA-binding PucR family transcriptional regulator [Mycobacterium frederiksbergense]|uniref:DNA-binding PucR family transcriptional regulator n=1 Tax=Mycolicibacterium frederiksbergense TaxID=117567 RepID=A0ABT6KZ75_9MYCO|nr:helix-turn-helix domain-containing protein [Mycolicibacterium frederiksbergense]MDH6196002.1 DNA-binding PucR family transcriptional regulator [Mycolicibacterium frederiksbergense]
MEPAWAGAQDDEQRRVWSAVLRPAAAELIERAREISAAVNDDTRARLSDLLVNEQALEVNRASTEASIRDFAQVLSAGDDPFRAVQLQSPTLDYARDGAQHGIPLTTLMRSYRLAHAATAAHFNAILQNHASNAEELHLASELGSAWMFSYVDAALCLVEEVYTAERDRWLRSAAASQAETIATILAGEPIDIEVATRRLRHDVRRVHIAAIAWLESHEEGRNTQAVLEAAIRDIASAIGNQKPLVHPLGILSTAAWISSNSHIPSKVLDELRFRTSNAPGVRVAIGEPAPGIGGFRSSYVQAVEAQRVARLAGRAVGSVTRYDSVALRAIATANIDQARDFVRRELGPLGEMDETTRRLAVTVRAYLDENCSRGRTAKRLHVHDNTVAYRIRQAEELLGRSLERRTLELRVALALADVVAETSDSGAAAPAQADSLRRAN